MEFFQLIGEAWVQRALLASCMVGIMCGVLGSFIVLRNMALLGDAISHATLPGIVLAFVIFGYNTLGFFVGSLTAGMLTAVIITWIQQKVDTKNDAAIGISYTLMFAIGVAWISKVSHDDGVHLDLKDFLIGNMLGVGNDDLYLMFTVMVYVVISILVFYRYFFAVTFEPIIAQTMGVSVKVIHYFLMLILSFVVVSSLKSVGLILVVAMLIVPASTALLLSNRLPVVLIIAGFVGLLAAVFGLIISIEFETTPGPMMVIVAATCYFLAMLFSPKKGLITKSLLARRNRYRILREDILKHAYRMSEQAPVQIEQLAERINQAIPFVQKGLKRLKRQFPCVLPKNDSKDKLVGKYHNQTSNPPFVL